MGQLLEGEQYYKGFSVTQAGRTAGWGTPGPRAVHKILWSGPAKATTGGNKAKSIYGGPILKPIISCGPRMMSYVSTGLLAVKRLPRAVIQARETRASVMSSHVNTRHAVRGRVSDCTALGDRAHCLSVQFVQAQASRAHAPLAIILPGISWFVRRKELLARDVPTSLRPSSQSSKQAHRPGPRVRSDRVPGPIGSSPSSRQPQPGVHACIHSDWPGILNHVRSLLLCALGLKGKASLSHSR